MTEPRVEQRSPEGYLLGHSARELDRLGTQARVVDPITRRFFLGAGLAPGMRVLDIGSGAGDVAFLAADIVGESGEVIGVDRVASALEVARSRTQKRSLRHVTFREGDPAATKFDRPFDAVVSRYVLMFQPDPVAMLRSIAGHLGPRGLIVCHEPHWTPVRSFPTVSSYDQCYDWVERTVLASGTDPHMGLRLHATFIAAGLAAPTMRVEALVGGGTNSVDTATLLADLTETLVPAMERMGVASAAEVDQESLAPRMIEEAVARNGVLVGRLEVGAWARA